MRSLSEAVTKRDAFSIFGEHVAASLRSSNRPQLEISVAQHHISEILFRLQIGSFATQIPRVYQTYQQNVPDINDSGCNYQSYSRSPSVISGSSDTEHPILPPTSDGIPTSENYNIQSFVSNFTRN